jgi:outer membrane protein TolC
MFTNTLEIRQPLYTFGSLSAARKAGKAGVRAEEQLLARDQWKLRYEIAELYYGYQLAYELSDLTGDFVNKLEKALDHFAKIKKNAPSKITYAIAELKAQNLEALKAKEQSRLAMAWKLGKLDNAYDLQWDQSNLSIREMPEEKMKDWKKNFSDSRPEWKALNEESEAKSALADVEDGQAWPQIYLFAKGQYNESSHRKNTSSGPFSYDPSNTKVAVGGVGLRWNFGFWELKAQRAKARAEAKKVVAKKNYLQQGMLLEAQKNLLDWKQKKDSIEWRAKASQDASRAWKEAQISFGMKNITGEKLFEAMGEYGSQQKKYLETIYQLNLSSFKFEQSVGQEF